MHDPVNYRSQGLEGYKLRLRFRDGVTGTAYLSGERWGPVFGPSRTQRSSQRPRRIPELHTVTWPDGTHLSPEFRYKHAAQASVAADAPQASRR